MRKNAFKFSRSDIEWCALLAHKTYLQKKNENESAVFRHMPEKYECENE